MCQLRWHARQVLMVHVNAVELSAHRDMHHVYSTAIQFKHVACLEQYAANVQP